MSPKDHRRILGLLVDQIERGQSLTDEQLGFLMLAFRRIASGESSDVVFGLDRKSGITNQQLKAKEELSVIFHWVANASLPVDQGGLGMSKSKALAEAATRSGKDLQYLRNQWYNKANKHLRDPLRNPFDTDFPY